MDIEAIKKALGLPPEATEDQVMVAIKAGAQAVEDLAAERTKAEAADADKAKAEGELANACGERDEAKTELANCKKQLEEAKTALANEKAQRAPEGRADVTDAFSCRELYQKRGMRGDGAATAKSRK